MVAVLYRSKKKPCSGSAIVEFTLLLPLMVGVTGLLILTTIFLMQVNIALDAVRVGGRVAALNSDTGVTCSSLTALAEQETANFLGQISENGGSTLGFYENWSSATSSISTGSWDGFPFQTLTVQLSSSGSSCTFCLGEYFFPDGVVARSTYILSVPCV